MTGPLVIELPLTPLTQAQVIGLSHHYQGEQDAQWRYVARHVADYHQWPKGMRLTRVEFTPLFPDAEPGEQVDVYPCAHSMLQGLRKAGVVVKSPAITWLPAERSETVGARLAMWPEVAHVAA